VHDPDLLLLDEPTNGLDPAGRDAMLGLVERIGADFGMSVLVCSHLLGEVERICESLVAIDAGRLLRADRVASMTRRRDVLVVEVDEGVERLAAHLDELGVAVRRSGRELLVPLESDDTFDLIMRAVAGLGLPLHRLGQRRHGIVELFADTSAGRAVEYAQEADHGIG